MISNPAQKKMIQYRFSGELVKEIPIPSSSGQFRILNDDVIALHIGRLAASHDSTLFNDLIFLNLEGNPLSKQFPHNRPLHFEFGNTFSRPNHDGSFYYSKQFDFNLYQIKDTTTPEVRFSFNYSNKMASYDDLDGPGIEDMGALRKAGKIVLIDNLINTYTHIGLRNYTQRKASLTLINKKSGDIKILGVKSQNILGNYHGLKIPFPSDSHQEYFLSTIDAIDFIEMLDNLDSEQNQYLSKKVEGFDIASLSKEDSNPILIYYKFK